MADTGVFVHPNGLCESTDVGAGTRVWGFAHVMKGAVVGRDCNIGAHAFVETGARIGDGVTVKNGVMVWAGVSLGDGCFVGPGAVFTNDRYPRSARIDHPEIRKRYADPKGWLVETTVGEGATIGAGAVIGPAVTIGAWSMVGAGAVVTHDVAAFRIVVGTPAAESGWVCRAGTRLTSGADGSLACSLCGRRVSDPRALALESC